MSIESRRWRNGMRMIFCRILLVILASIAAPTLAANRIVKLPPKTQDGITWQVHEEKHSGMRMPFLVAGAPKEVIAKINRKLGERFANDIETASTAEEFTPENRVLFANRRYFVVGGGTSAYFSGALHPLYVFQVTVFDLKTGEPAELHRLFRYGRDENREIDLARTDALDALILRAYMKSAERNKHKEPNCWGLVAEWNGCQKEDDGSAWCADAGDLAYATLYPTTKGLAVTIDIYAEQERGCRGEGVVLPWPTVRKALLNPIPMP